MFLPSLFFLKPKDHLANLAAQIWRATAVTPDLMADFVAFACPRLLLLNKTGKVAVTIYRLIEAEAWLDAVTALIAVEPPQWKLRRLVYDDGAWLCSLSKQPNLPLGTDDCIDATHENMVLAIMRAFVEAKR